MSRVLVIVDVQKEFAKFIQGDLVDELYDYAEKFDKVYQIWDSNQNQIAPTYEFPNQVETVKKKFGKNHFNGKIQKFTQDVEDISPEGTTFKLTDGNGYVVRVDNNHEWFYVNPEITNMIEEIKDDDVVLVGGADGECLEDVEVAFKAFGLSFRVNKKYVYSAKTRNKDSVNESARQDYEYKEVCYYIRDIDDRDRLDSFMTDISRGNWLPVGTVLHNQLPPIYLFINIYDFDWGWDNNSSVNRNGGISSYMREYTTDCDPEVYDSDSFKYFKNIMLHGKKITSPDYSPRKIIRESSKVTRSELVKRLNENKYDIVIIKVTGDYQKNELNNLIRSYNDNVFNSFYASYDPAYVWIVLKNSNAYSLGQFFVASIYTSYVDDGPYLREYEGTNFYPKILNMDDYYEVKRNLDLLFLGGMSAKDMYRPRNIIKESNTYPYREIVYKAETPEDNRRVMIFLRDNKYNIWERTPMEISERECPNYIFVHLSLREVTNISKTELYMYNDNEDINQYIEEETGIDPNIFTKSTYINFRSIVLGQGRIPDYKPKNIVRESNESYPYRFKTKDEFEKEFGDYWRISVASYFTVDMDYLLNQPYPFYVEKGDTLHNLDGWNISWDMLTKNKPTTPSYQPRNITRENVHTDIIKENLYSELKKIIDSGGPIKVLTNNLTDSLWLEDYLLSNEYDYAYDGGSDQKYVQLYYDIYNLSRSFTHLVFNINPTRKIISLEIRIGPIPGIYVNFEEDKEYILRVLGYKPSYKPRKIIRESINNYPIIVFKINNDDDYDIICDVTKRFPKWYTDQNLMVFDSLRRMINSNNSYPTYLFYDFSEYNISALWNEYDTELESKKIYDRYITNDSEVDNNVYDVDSLDKFKIRLLLDNKSPSYKPRDIIKESVNKYLKPKSEEEIENSLILSIENIADSALDMYPERFDDWLDTFNFFKDNYEDTIKEYLEDGYTIDEILDSIMEDDW